MDTEQCTLLDDYLDGVLAPSAVDRFVEHLPDCAACREAVAFEQNLAATIRAADRETAVPESLAVSTRQAIHRWQRRRRLTWTAGIVASLIVWVLFVSRHRERNAAPELREVAEDVVSPSQTEPQSPPEQIPAVVEVVDSTPPPERAIVRAGPTGRPRHIAVPQPTENENVTFVMLLPTIGPREARTDDTPQSFPDDTPFRKGTYQ